MVTTVVASTYTLHFILLHCYSDLVLVPCNCNSFICEHCLKPYNGPFPNNLTGICNIKCLTIRRPHFYLMCMALLMMVHFVHSVPTISIVSEFLTTIIIITFYVLNIRRNLEAQLHDCDPRRATKKKQEYSEHTT